MPSAQDVLQENIKRAIETYKDHELILRDDANGRWRIATRYEDGSVCSNMATEVISLWGGRLFVGGDGPHCIFGYYSGGAEQDTERWHAEKLCWMGRHYSVGYYITQKAAIGMGGGDEGTKEWDGDVAAHELQALLNDEDYEWEEDERETLQEGLIMAKRGDHQFEVMTHLHNGALHDTECLYELGMVVTARVVLAWAKCRKLCDLLYGVPEKREEPR